MAAELVQFQATVRLYNWAPRLSKRAPASRGRIRYQGDNHTVAAPARTRAGRIVAAANAHHVTGSPCGEPVLIGTAAAQGVYERDTILAVGDRDPGVIPPCRRCGSVGVLVEVLSQVRMNALSLVIVRMPCGVGRSGR
ncbi:cytidine/deoxycytidylate deaminase family protein [Streptomyces vinaceus]|uniref:hypothetical protein n=1 Tax=Streptomyces vinaceus TaxID=1960 RepID=UPI0036C1714E